MSSHAPTAQPAFAPVPGQPLPLMRGGVLDALRFLAAFCMVVYHFSFASPVPLAKIHPVFERGYLATDFFLIVSGYVLARIYGERVAKAQVGAGAFFLRRAQRLVPAHLIMIGAFVLLMGVSVAAHVAPQHPEFLDWRDLPGELFLVQAFGVPGGVGWNSPTWSLSALLGCYLLFPPFWRAQARIRQPWLVVALVFGFMLLADAASSMLMGVRIYEFPSQIGFVRAMPLFLLGAAAGRVSETFYIPERIAQALTWGSAAALVAVQMAGRYDFMSIALLAIMVMGAGAIPVKRPSYVLERAALVSFAIFITNEFVRTVYAGALHVVTHGRELSMPVAWAAWWLALATALVAAVAFHYLIDMPVQGWIKTMRRRPASGNLEVAPAE